MDLEALSKRFFVRALETEDVDIIYDLCSKNKLFYEFHQPFVTRESILDDRMRCRLERAKRIKRISDCLTGIRWLL